jgi:adenosylcobinamide kinase/adenosylcobinamide-phosphate guanylyltransferase
MVAVESLPRLSLVSGPASGGKSRWAEHLASRSGLGVVYLATGPDLPHDSAWQERLDRHRRRRPASWVCREVGGDLARALEQLESGQVALVDSLGTWVAAHLDSLEETWQNLTVELVAALERCAGPVLLVVEETGWGVVPASAAGGLFRQRLGELQQRLGQRADAAWLVLQGRALDLHRLGLPLPPDG